MSPSRSRTRRRSRCAAAAKASASPDENNFTGAVRERGHPEPGQSTLQARVRFRHRVGRCAEGVERGRYPPDFGEKRRARMAAGVPPEGVSPLADHAGTDLAERQIPENRLPEHKLFLCAEAEK